MARLLIEKGYREVWPLLGGFDGWVELGYPTEPVASPAPGLDFHRGGKFFGLASDDQDWQGFPARADGPGIQLLAAERLYQ